MVVLEASCMPAHTCAAAGSTRPLAPVTGSYTVAAWADLAGHTGNNQSIVAQAAGTDSGFYLKYTPGSGKWEFFQPHTDTDGPATSGVDSAGPAVTGRWTFLTGTYDAGSGTLTLYVDGQATGTAVNTSPIASTGPLLIGRSKWAGNPTDFFDGQIAGVRTPHGSATTAACPPR